VAVAEADAWRWDQRLQLAVTAAWYSAKFAHAKRLPSLKNVLRPFKRKPRRQRKQTPEDQIAIMTAIFAQRKGR